MLGRCRTTAEFLPQKPDFHPKRNQARQKLSTLPKTRFRDLASDVYFELERRYPEFKEDELPPSPTGTSGPEDPGRNQYNGQPNSSSTRAGTNGTYAAPSSSNVPQAMSRSGSRDDSQNGPRLQSSTSQKRPQFPQGKPSQIDYNQQSSSSSAAAPSAAANEVIIPNKSKVIEEDISLPASAPSNVSQQQRGYGSYANQNGYMGRKSSDRERPGANGNTSQESVERDSPSPNNNTLGGANDQQQPPRKSNDTPRMVNNGPLLPTSPDWNNSLARASEASSLGTRLIGGYGSTPSEGGMREWESDEIEKVKSDYEYKIATMQNRMAGLEKDLRDAMDAKEKDESDSRDRIHQLENEVEKLKMRLEDAQSSIEQLEQDLAEAQEQAKSLPAYDEASSREKDEQHQAELSDLRNELDSFRSKHSMQQDATENLKNEIEGLVDTLKEMNTRQDDLVNERDADLEKIHKLEEEVKEWRNRYETAKTELRDLKATSQLFVKPTKADEDYMPTSPHGAIMDSHVTRFQSSIDDLLISGR